MDVNSSYSWWLPRRHRELVLKINATLEACRVWPTLCEVVTRSGLSFDRAKISATVFITIALYDRLKKTIPAY